jgi:hypothetical protein
MVSCSKLSLPWVALVLFFGVVGCGESGPKIVKVEGMLAYKGKPVTNAYIDFVPGPGEGRPSWGQTDAQGRFKLHYDRKQEGAVVGKHKVYVRMRPTTPAEQQAVMMGRPAPLSKEMAAFFDKYSVENSKAEVVIEKSTSDLKLDWE